MMVPKGSPTVPVTPVNLDDDLSLLKTPPEVKPLSECVEGPVWIQPFDYVTMAGCEGQEMYGVPVSM